MVYYRELDLIGDYCGDKRDHSGQLQEMEYHWCLLWGHEGFIVVYCRELKIIGDYCDTSPDAQVTTLDSRPIPEANCKGRKANGEYSDTHPITLTSTILHN